jgi:hypothetical protein
MRAEPASPGPVLRVTERAPRWCAPAVGLAALVGLVLLADSLGRSSSTYDEVAYLRVSAWWLRSGDDDGITRMGSPLTFWKLQYVPVLCTLDLAGHADWVDNPVRYQARVLPWVRAWSLSLWLIAFGLTVVWTRRLYGPRAMVLGAWLFTLSPNLLAHGALATMELPLVAGMTAMFLLFWRFLQFRDRRDFMSSAALGGLVGSCKYTTVLVPPIFAVIWWIDAWRVRRESLRRATLHVVRGMLVFVAIAVLANLVVTGFAMIPPSERVGAHPTIDGRFGPNLGPWVQRVLETPLPQDWVGFATQARHQRSGGPSYLLGERRMTGWWSYYFVALAVKVPLTFWLLVIGRVVLRRRIPSAGRDRILPLAIGMFLAIAAAGSSRNFGIRYLLPLAPLAIVWVSGIAEGGRAGIALAAIGVAGQAVAVAAIHPHELTYFNALAGGPMGGRRILADSNLDWGQGLRALVRLQRQHPELRDLTLYYFGDTRPENYGVAGICQVIDATDLHPGLPEHLEAQTSYLAVSASLQWGPWGPAGYFDALNNVAPVRMTDDLTIAVYRTADIPRATAGAR